MSPEAGTVTDILAERILARLTRRCEELRAMLGQHPERVFVHPLGDNWELGEIHSVPHLDWWTRGVNRTHPRPWPGALPLPLTFGQALEAIEHERGEMSEHLAEKIERGARILFESDAILDAVLARELVADRWPWPDRHMTDTPGWLALQYLEEAAVFDGRAVRGEESRKKRDAHRTPVSWPPEVAALDVAEWARAALNTADEPLGDMLLAAVRLEEPVSDTYFVRAGEEPDEGLHLETYGLGLLYLAWLDVDRGRKRPAIALDSNREHHELLEGWRDVQKNPRRAADILKVDGRLELLAPSAKKPRSVQLTLGLGGEETISDALVRAIRDLFQWKGLRHWAALQRLFSVEGGREGWVRWTLDAHLEAMGYTPKERSRLAVRDAAAREVETFTSLELGVYDDTGTLRRRLPLVIAGQRFEQLKGSKWRLDGMDLEVNPMLYRGVRDPNTRKLGQNWHPAPPELAQVDHVRHPYTISLGLILPIRWRLALNEGKKSVTLKGRSLLSLAGIKASKNDPGKAWKALARDLAELQRIGGLGRWEWLDAENTMEGRVRLYPSGWMTDRTVRGIAPFELPPGPAVFTGRELREWREARGLSQARAAEALGVGMATVKRAESAPAEPLGRALREALRVAG